MNSLVCIKEIPDPEIPPVKFKLDTESLSVLPPEGIPSIINPYDEQAVEFEIEQATDFHQSRSERSQEMDERKKAHDTITEKQIARNPEDLNKWYELPNRYDIKGVDG